jgi:K+-transporting ATPase ATPase C chain
MYTTALKVFLGLTLLTGIGYPLLITAIAQTCFPTQANGVGSTRIDPSWDHPPYFTRRTDSGSQQDPHITYIQAISQVPRIAEIRHIPAQKIHALINHHKETSLFTEPYVNVLRLNRALDLL